jgi:putative membrane protein
MRNRTTARHLQNVLRIPYQALSKGIIMKSSKILGASLLALLLPLQAFAGSGQATTTFGGVLPGDQGQSQQEPAQRPTTRLPTTSATQGSTTQPTTQPTAPQQSQVQITAEDRTVLQTLHMTNISEIKASLVAFEKVTSPEVRDYAWKIVMDHIASEERVIALGKKYNVELVSTEQTFAASQSESDTFLQTLKDTPDAQFGEAYLSGMETSHQAVISKLEGYQDLKLASDIDNFLDQSIQHIRDHEQLAQSVSAEPTEAPRS